MFHRPLLDVPDPFPSFCSTPPPTAQTSMPTTGIRRSPLRHSARRITVWPHGRTHSSHITDADCEHRTLKTRISKFLADACPNLVDDDACQCSMTSSGQREEIQKTHFKIPKKSRITRRGSREDTGHSEAQVLKKTGTELSTTHLKGNGTPSPPRWWDISK